MEHHLGGEFDGFSSGNASGGFSHRQNPYKNDWNGLSKKLSNFGNPHGLCVFKRISFLNIVADDDDITFLQGKSSHLVKVMLTR